MGNILELLALPSGNAAHQVVDEPLPGSGILDQGRRHGRSAAGAAVQNQICFRRDFMHPLLDFRQRDELRAGNVLGLVFSRLTDIDDQIFLFPGLGSVLFQFVGKNVDHISHEIRLAWHILPSDTPSTAKADINP